jgi:hypothetical protein
LFDGICLTGQTATSHINEKVVLGLKTKGLEGSLDRCKINGIVIEIVVTGAAIDGDATGSRHDTDPGNGRFTASRSPIDNAVG